MRIAFTVTAAVTAAVFVLAACGGGGSGGKPVSMMEPPPPEIKPPPPPPETSALTPGASFGSTGQDWYPLNARFQRIGRPSREEYNREFYEAALEHYQEGTCCWEMAKGTSPIASREDVLAMLRENIFSFNDIVDINADPSDTPGVQEGIWGYKSPPVVRVVSGWGPKGALQRAIDNINAWLPYKAHITIGADITADADPGGNVIKAELLADSDKYDGIGNFGGIEIKATSTGSISLIQHELLHALGMGGGRSCYETFGSNCDDGSVSGLQRAYSHVPVARFPESTMAYVSPYWDGHGLSQIDGETLQTIYTKLHGKREFPSNHPAAFVIEDEAISAEDLGPWDDTVIRYRGSLKIGTDYQAYGHSTVDNRRFWHSTGSDPLSIEAAFGVDWRNGMARPWTVGGAPDDALAATGLSGSATWTGELVGFTPLQEAVHGDSAIVADLARMTGNAAFTALEHWNAGAAPGDPGTGAQWGDGDLHYSLALDGNYLRSNGGDEGYVSGRFVGGRAQGAVGILERPDLTAAFGASR